MSCSGFCVGDPTAPDSKLGALISAEHLVKVKGYVDAALSQGAVSLCGYRSLRSQDWEQLLPEKHRKVIFNAVLLNKFVIRGS